MTLRVIRVEQGSAMVKYHSLFLITTVLSVAIKLQDAKKDVWMIAVDDLRPELGCYGADNMIKTPTIDSLASHSIRELIAKSLYALHPELPCSLAGGQTPIMCGG